MPSSFETVNIFANSLLEYNDGIHEMLNDNFSFSNVDDANEDAISSGRERMTQDAEKYYFLLKEVEQELYPNCKTFTKIS